MRRTAIILILSALIIFAAALNVSAQAPNTIMYQGRLTNADGTPITGVVDDVRFRIYSGDHDAILKAIYYEQTSAIECDENGVFTIELGPITNPNATAGYARYLGIKVGTDDEMIPYQKLTSTLYSMSTADMPGVDWVEEDAGYTISEVSTSSVVDSVEVSAPGAGYIMVTASGSIYWNIVSTNYGMLRVKVSDAANDVSETPGLQMIRQEFPGTTTNPMCAYSVSMVFPVDGAGNYKYYLNIWHQVVNGTAQTTDYSLIAMFVPNKY